MHEMPKPPRYGGLAQGLHWATAILVLVAFVYGPGGSEARVYSAAKDWDRQFHETLGIAVLAVTLIRLAWRTTYVAPEAAPLQPWMASASKLVQTTLYVLLLAVPLTAVAGAWLEGHPLTLLGNARIGPFVAEAHAIGSTIASIHTWLGDAILWIAGLHAAAALFHHFFLRDGVLRSMLPGQVKPR